MENKIKLLDCTLRDGAHLNKGQFGKRVITETIAGLVQAKLDIIEIGFFNNEPNDENTSYYNSIAAAKKVLPADKGSSRFSMMADFVDVSQVEPYDGTIDFFRLSFKRHRLDWGLSAARILMDKGYRTFINPVNCTVYSDTEYLSVIEKVNKLKPYGFSIVDTFGVLRKETLSRIYYLLEGNLDPDITIGLHLHENLGLAYSLAQHFLEIRNPKRKISIDCSLLGMGRVPGNLCTEQIMDHMNIYMGREYNTEPALDLIDDHIAPIKRDIPWGYSIPYALSGKYGVHRTYAEFLLGKHRLKTKDIQRILSLIDKDHIEMFDEAYIEDLYRQYVATTYNDDESVCLLGQQLNGKSILVVCPGGSITKHKDKICEYASQENVVVISVNFIPEFLTPDFVFCANAKRFHNIQSAKNIRRLITSNIIDSAHEEYDLAFSFNDCVYFNEAFCEDSTVMLLRVILRCGCTNVAIAGFDGFVPGGTNYYKEAYTNEKGNYVNAKTIRHILSEALAELNIRFLTPSAYE